MTPESPHAALLRDDGTPLAFRSMAGRTPTVVFLPGFRSDMTGTKATAIAEHCRATGQAGVLFDYFGHGVSGGEFTAGTIGRWIEDAVVMIDRAAGDGPVVLVGSSMGGWIMVRAAMQRRERVAALVGVAAAPDFTEDLIWRSASDEVRTTLRRDGVYYQPSPYDPTPTPITLRLIEEGRRHLVLRRPIELDCPVRLIHGTADREVPYVLSLRLSAALRSSDVRVTLVKEGDHRLSRPSDIALLLATIDEVSGRDAAAPAAR
jgi:pimeloyl-ACP methyl ester carboxylesterase